MFSTCSKPTSIFIASAFIMVASSPSIKTVVASTTSEDIFSNIDHSTHCGWLDDNTGNTSIETHDEVKSTIEKYLYENIMIYDKTREQSLGYTVNKYQINNEEQSAAVSRALGEKDIDGLSDGVLNDSILLSIKAKTLYPWTDHIPKDVYLEYVTPYAVVNEPRTNHRALLFNAIQDMMKKYERSNQYQQQQSPQEQIKEVVKLINTRLWSTLGRPDKPIVFKAGLTPKIYDPLSVIAFGYSSCTGLAITLISALRSVGIPCRMAGTPAWYGDSDKGNHSWVEVWVPDGNGGGQWQFLEPTPGIAEGDEDTANADHLDRDPCKRWFCKADRFPASKVYATRYTKNDSNSFYPQPWSSLEDDGVVGEDRTEYYGNICSKCT